MSSPLLFKVVAHSYLRYNNQINIMEDCLSAITNKIGQLDNKISTQVKQIAEVLSLPSQTSDNDMSVIMQEQSQRSLNQYQYDSLGSERKNNGNKITYQKKMKKMKQKHNIQINKMNGIQNKIDKLIGIYKNELLQISKQMTKWQTKNQELKKQIKIILKQKQECQLQNNQLKDQITIQSAKMLMQESQVENNEQIPPQIEQNIESVFSNNSKPTHKFTPPFHRQQVYKFKIKNHNEKLTPKITKQQQKSNGNSQPVGARSKNNKTSNKGQIKAQEIKIDNKKKQVDEDMQKWKKLSKKIDELKTKLLSYEQQMEQKEQKIRKLTCQIKDLKAQENGEQEQKRKIKTSNTTLRGEKTVLLNQITSLKRQLLQKSQIASLMQAQNIELKKQVQSFSQTIKWQSSTIQDLNSAVKVKQNKHNTENTDTINSLQRMNQTLYKALCEQEQHLLSIQQQTKNIDELYTKQINSMKGQITELQMILDEKNQYIVRMKSKSAHGSQNVNPNVHPQVQNGYLGQLVKVLTKKVADRDQTIRRMEESR